MKPPKVKIEKCNKRTAIPCAKFTIGDRQLSITLDYMPLKKLILERGFKSWSAFRRYTGVSSNIIADLSKGRPISVETLAYIAYMLGVTLQNIITFHYVDIVGGKQKEISLNGMVQESVNAAQKDAEALIKIETARILGMFSTPTIK